MFKLFKQLQPIAMPTGQTASKHTQHAKHTKRELSIQCCTKCIPLTHLNLQSLRLSRFGEKHTSVQKVQIYTVEPTSNRYIHIPFDNNIGIYIYRLTTTKLSPPHTRVCSLHDYIWYERDSLAIMQRHLAIVYSKHNKH